MSSAIIHHEIAAADERLRALGLDRADLLQVVHEAVAAKNEAVAIDPVNAPGLLAYIYGTRALRRGLLPKGWRIDRADNIEATVEPHSGTRLIYQNCDACCDSEREPRAISAKGPAAGRLIREANGDFFPELLHERIRELQGQVWFLCVSIADDDARAELSCPGSIDRRQFGDFIERIFVLRAGEFDGTAVRRRDADAGSNTEAPEVRISRKGRD
jgi:hypothetical protein